MGSRVSKRVRDLESGHPCDLEAFSDFGYLLVRRRWSRVLVPPGAEGSSYYGGISLKSLLSQKKSDLQICGLPYNGMLC